MISNRSKRTISTSGRLGLLQMVLESRKGVDTRRCARKDVGP